MKKGKKMELKTISFFKEISKIPRESGHEEKIAKYLCDFAERRKLFYQIDCYNNVLIKKKTSEKKPIILQAHTDMVCEKEKNKDFNFNTDSIEVIEENGYLMANGTTLGADNGVGVALILAILDSDLPCNIEAIFTTSEETTMIGAINFDTSKLEGRQLLNLDGFEENTILSESACFYDIILNSFYHFQEHLAGDIYTIQLTGLPGGHSGMEIDKNISNSCIELAKLLREFAEIELIDFVGGTKFNVIPSQASAKYYTTLSQQEMQNQCQTYERELQRKYPEVKIILKLEKGKEKSINFIETKQFLELISSYKHGVFRMNEKNKATTSINLGVVDLKKQEIKIGMRSSKKIEEEECLEWIQNNATQNDLEFHILGHQPGFEAKKDSDLIKKLLEAHPTELFHSEKPQIQSVHITVEVGFFKEKIPDLEIAIISANIQGAHTPREKVEIASIDRLNQWIIKFLSSNDN